MGTISPALSAQALQAALRSKKLYSILQATIRMSFSANRLNLTPGSLYVDKLAVRHILPIDQQNNEYSTNTIFAVAVNGELEGYNPATWFSSIGYTDPSTIQGELISSMAVMNAADQSTVAGLGTAGYVSSSGLEVALVSTVGGLTTTTPVSLSLFYNTLNALADSPYNYVSSTQLASTVAGLGSARYVSTTADGILAAKAISTGNVTTSTVTLRDTVTSAEGVLYSQNGGLFFNGLSLAASMDISVNTVRASSYVSTATVNVQKKSAPRTWAVAGGTGQLQLSVDNGVSWSVAQNLFGVGGTIQKIYYLGGRWYALGYNSGTGITLRYSADGSTWTDVVASLTIGNTYSLAYNGSSYMLGAGGSIYTSADGITWSTTAISTPFTGPINDIIYTGSRWLATGSNTPSVRYSTDGGATWQSATGTMPSTGSSLAKNGQVIVIAGNDSTNNLCYSTDDGLAWQQASNIFTNNANSVTWNTVHFVAGGNSGIKYSADGRTWINASGISTDVKSVFWNGRLTYATNGTTVYVSADYGRTWTALASQPSIGSYVSIAYSVDGRDDLLTTNGTVYGVDIPHYYNSTNQIFNAPDKIIINDTLNVRVGTIGVMKGDPSAEYHLDVAGAINASTVYVSSAQFNDVAGTGRVGMDIAGGMLRIGGVAVFQSTVAGLGNSNYVSTSGLVSTVAGLGQAGYVGTTGLTSTVAGLGTANYVSTTGLVSTVAGLGTANYVSTTGLASTVAGLGQTYVSTQSLTSTVQGLGQTYVSTQSLTSTVQGLGQTYVSTIGLTSTVAGLGQTYVSVNTLYEKYVSADTINLYITSTVAGLGLIYMSTTSVTSTLAYAFPSTVIGIGSVYVSTDTLNYAFASTVGGLGTAGYLNTAALNQGLTSTVAGLGQKYISTESFNYGLTSTVAGLGTVGYLSSAALNAAVVSTLRLTSQTNRNTPYRVDLVNEAAINNVSAITRIKEGYLNSINENRPQLLIQGVNNTTNYDHGLGLLTDGNSARIQFTKAGPPDISTIIEFNNGRIGINKAPQSGYILDISGNLNVGGSITATSLNVPLTFTNLAVQNLVTSTLGANSDATIEGSMYLGGTQNTSWYPQRWICGADGTDNSGTIYYSDNNGVTWLPVSGSKANIFTSQGGKAVWNGSMWAMNGSGTRSRLAYSMNGLNWTDCSNATDSSGSTSLFTNVCNDIAWNGQLWVACGRGNYLVDNSGAICYSSDGISWTRASGIGLLTIGESATRTLNPAVNCLKWNGYMWLAGINTGTSTTTGGLSNKSLLYSYNGITWAQVPNSTNLFSQSCSTIEWNGYVWVIGGYSDAAGSISMHYSYDGFNWSPVTTTPFGQFCTNIKWNGIMFVGSGYGATQSPTNNIGYSYDGINWTGLGRTFFNTGSIPYRADGIGWNGKKWLLSGYGQRNNTMITSTDGINWSYVTNDISGAAFNPSYSVDTDPDLRMTNFNVYAQAVPNYLTSSNQILVGPSTITLNNVVQINKDSKNTAIDGSLFIGSADATTNYKLVINSTGKSGSISLDGTTQAVIDNARNRAVNGATGGPTYAFLSDETTGMYRAAAGTIGLVGSGVEGVRIDNSGIQFKDGTVTKPSINFGLGSTTDPDTGIYHPANNTLAFVTAGTECMRIDASGNVGIGTTSPATALDISGALTIAGSASGSGFGTLPNTYITFKDNGSSNDYVNLRQIGGSNAITLSYDYSDDVTDVRFTLRNINGGPWEVLRVDNDTAGTGSSGTMQVRQYSTTTTTQAIPAISLRNAASRDLDLHTSLGVDNYNINVETGDKGIIYNNSTGSSTAGLTIGPWLTNGGALRLDTSGNTKIFTTLNNALEVRNMVGDSRIWLYPATGGNSCEIKRLDGVNGNVDIINNGTGQINITANNTAYTGISILNNGRVGIGKTNPSANLDVSGSLSKSSGSFDIAHPIVPNKRLVHSFIEGPRCDNIYRGEVNLVNGNAIVNLDRDCVKDEECAMTEGTFEALCANPMVYLQNNETYDRVKGTINGNKLTITCENPGATAKINWLVVGERKDTFIKTWERTNNEGYLITEYMN